MPPQVVKSEMLLSTELNETDVSRLIIGASGVDFSPHRLEQKLHGRSQSPRSTVTPPRPKRKYHRRTLSPLHMIQDLLFPGGLSAAYCNEETLSTSFLVLDGFMTIFLGEFSDEGASLSSEALRVATERWGRRLETNISVGKVSYEYRLSDEVEMSTGGDISRSEAPIISQNLEKVPLVLDQEPNERKILNPKFYFPPSHKMVADGLKFQEYDTVAEVYESILEADIDRYGEFDLVCAIDFHNLGVANLLANDLNFALYYFQESVYRKRECLGHNDPHIADSLIEIGIILYHRGDNEGAIRFFKESMEVYNDSNNSEGAGRALNCIGCVYYQMGDVQSALSYLEQAMVAQKMALGTSEQAESSLLNFALTQANVGYAKLRCEKTDAIAMLEDSLLVLESVLGDDNATAASVRSTIAIAKQPNSPETSES